VSTNGDRGKQRTDNGNARRPTSDTERDWISDLPIMRFDVVENAIMVRWPCGRGREALTKAGWVRFTELRKFAFAALPISAAEFSELCTQLSPGRDNVPDREGTD
jgi:hypothetical protein